MATSPIKCNQAISTEGTVVWMFVNIIESLVNEEDLIDREGRCLFEQGLACKQNLCQPREPPAAQARAKGFHSKDMHSKSNG